MTLTTDRNPSGAPGGWRWSWFLAVLLALLISEQVIGEERPMNVLFIAVGLRKPHLPFCAPARYWDLYNRAKILDAEYDQYPEGAPELVVRSWREIEGYTDIPNDDTIDGVKRLELRHGYYACVSYIDALVGRTRNRVR